MRLVRISKCLKLETTAVEEQILECSKASLLLLQNEYVFSYKQARRREDDIAIVNAGMRVLLEPSSPHWLVRECAISYGGMSYITVAAKKTQQALLGK